MRGGKLRRVVSIETRTDTQDGTGAPIPAWSTLSGASSLFAEILESPGREQIQAGQVNPQSPIEVHIRYFAGVTPRMRVVYGTRTFEIQTVVNVNERNREMILTCLEKN